MNDIADRHLHIVSFDVPWPANYGGVIDVYYKMLALSEKGIKVHLHTYEYGRAEAECLNEICYSVKYYKRDQSKSNLFKSLPYIVSSRNSEELATQLLRDNYPILLEGLHTCLILSDIRFSNRHIVVRTHNIEHEYYQHLAKAESDLLKKYYYHNEAAKLHRFEQILTRAKAIVAISKKDEQYFSRKYQNAHFIPAFHPHQEVMSQPGKGDFLLYHGNLSVNENKNAVKYLIEEVFNDISFPLIIAGLNPPDSLIKLAEANPNIRFEINPTDDRLFWLINNAHIHVLLTFQATGLKLKLLNTLYNGRFCVVNDKMLSGSTLDELCILANSAQQMKQQIKKLMRKDFTKREVERRRNKLSQMYHNGQNTQRLISLLFGD